MGSTRYQIEINAFVPNRREEGEPDPRALAEELRERVTAIVDDPKYASLTPFVI